MRVPSLWRWWLTPYNPSSLGQLAYWSPGWLQWTLERSLCNSWMPRGRKCLCLPCLTRVIISQPQTEALCPARKFFFKLSILWAEIFPAVPLVAAEAVLSSRFPWGGSMTRARRTNTPEVLPKMRSRRLAPSALPSVRKRHKPKWQEIPHKSVWKGAVNLRGCRDHKLIREVLRGESEVEERSRCPSRCIRRGVRGSWLRSRSAWIALPTRGATSGGSWASGSIHTSLGSKPVSRRKSSMISWIVSIKSSSSWSRRL